MSEPTSAPQAGGMQFETAEPTGAAAGAAGGLACAQCKQPLLGEYYETSGQIVCPGCKNTIAAALAGGGGRERFILAAVYGLGAAILGALLWWGVRAATGYELGLIAVAVGFGVGYGVRAGAQGRGGRRFQILALVLTYGGVTLNYVPDVIKGLAQAAATEDGKAGEGDGAATGKPSAPDAPPAKKAAEPSEKKAGSSFGVLQVLLAAALVVGIAAAAPFLGGAQNFLGILIIGFALWEAWKMNRRTQIAFTGPYQAAVAAPVVGPDPVTPPPAAT